MSNEKNPRIEYINGWKKSKVKRVPLEVTKDYYDTLLQPAAKRAQKSVNMYIKEALEFRMRAEGFTDETPNVTEEQYKEYLQRAKRR